MELATLILDRVEYDTNGGCWLWTGAGSGLRAKLQMPDGQQVAARVAYEVFRGPIPDGFFVCHRCDNPACVNPAHLFLGTPRDNVHDMIAKGRRVQPDAPRGAQHPNNVLSEEAVRVIQSIRQDRGARSLAKFFKTAASNIDSIWSGRSWAHLPDRPLTEAETALRQAVLEATPPKSKLSDEDAAYIRSVYQPRHPTFGAGALARRFGVTHGAVSMVASGLTHISSEGTGVELNKRPASAA